MATQNSTVAEIAIELQIDGLVDSIALFTEGALPIELDQIDQKIAEAKALIGSASELLVTVGTLNDAAEETEALADGVQSVLSLVSDLVDALGFPAGAATQTLEASLAAGTEVSAQLAQTPQSFPIFAVQLNALIADAVLVIESDFAPFVQALIQEQSTVLSGSSLSSGINGGAVEDSTISSSRDFEDLSQNDSPDYTEDKGDDVVMGDDRDNLIETGTGNDNLTGLGGDDTLNGGEGDDALFGGAGNDVMIGGAGQDTMFGGKGDDIFLDYEAGETIHGGTGSDMLDLAALAGNAALELDFTNGDLSDFEVVKTSAGSDTVIFRGGMNLVVTGDGADTVNAEGGTEDLSIDTGAGKDRVNMTLENTVTQMNLGDASDSVQVTGRLGDAASGELTLDGGTGNDAIFIRNNIAVDLTGANGHLLGAARGEDSEGSPEQASSHFDLTDIERFYLSGGDNKIDGEISHVRYVKGLGGDDHIDLSGHTGEGLGGKQIWLRGGAGKDVLAVNESFASKLEGERGDDILDAASGVLSSDATIEIFAGDGDDMIFAGGGINQIDGGDGVDALSYERHVASVSVDLVQNIVADSTGQTDSFANIELLIGSSLNDTFKGNNSANQIDGAGGNDSLHGNGGDDLILGGAGNDALGGGSGNDTLDGGAGNDRLFGSSGFDIIAFSTEEVENFGTDTIYGFTFGQDRIDLSGVAEVTSFDDLNIRQQGSVAVIDTGVGIIRLNGIVADDIRPFDFIGLDKVTLNGMTASYFNLPNGVSLLEQIDFRAAPVFEEKVTEINEATTGSFYAGGVSDNFAVIYHGNYLAEEAGSYQFNLTSDDGSELWIDGVRVIDNDGLHGARLLKGEVTLDEGAHTIELRYFEGKGSATVKLEVVTPGETEPALVDFTPILATDPVTLEGTSAGEILQGRAGDDIIFGAAGSDILLGEAGDDTLDGGSGDDVFTGGEGADVFAFNTFQEGEQDEITDFEAGTDQILLNIEILENGADAAFAALDITVTANGAQIDIDGHALLLHDVTADSLTIDDFQFA